MDTKEIARRLSEPFPADTIGWKPQTVKGDRALAVAYIDARDVIARLNDVLGVGGWQDHYRITDHGIICTLAVDVPGCITEHEDFGCFSDQPDDGDRYKAAFSDALKRAAVKIGVGAYLYSLPKQWCDFDPQKKQFLKTPQLPRWAVPGQAEKPKPAFDAETVAVWEQRLKHDPPLKEVNANLKELAAMSEPTKAAVFDLLKSWAERVGVLLDRKRKEYYVPDDVREGAQV